MMPITLPNPIETARAEAVRINANPQQYLEGPYERFQLDAPFLDWPALVAGLTDFHRERMARVPSFTKYPEAQPWVDFILAADRELQALTGMNDDQLAFYRSFNAYITFRGYKNAQLRPAGPPVTAEKCRAVYLPDTDRGQFHIKNVDDPMTFWKPNPNPIMHGGLRDRGLQSDGVGAGLHIDDEPEEIFPLRPLQMLPSYTDDVPGTVEFLTRYSPFWGGANMMYYDRRKRAVAIEKTSYNYIDIYGADRCGGVHISGMACRNPKTAQGKYVETRRKEFLEKFGRPADGVDTAYWSSADTYEERLAAFTDRPASPTVAETVELFTSPAPSGFNKWGAKFHPEQGYLQYTLVIEAWLHDERKALRWQRDAFGVFPCKPEVFWSADL